MTDKTKVVNRDLPIFASAATEAGMLNRSIDSKQLPALKEEEFEYVQTAGPPTATNDDPELNAYNTDRGMITGESSQPTEPDSATKMNRTGSIEVGDPDIASNHAAQLSVKHYWLKWFVILVLGITTIISSFHLAKVVLTNNATMPAAASAKISTDAIYEDDDDDTDYWDDYPELNIASVLGDEWNPEEAPFIFMSDSNVIFRWNGLPYNELDDLEDEQFSIYSIMVMTKDKNFEELECHLKGHKGMMDWSCVIEVEILMSEPFNLYYGDYVSAKFVGFKDEVEEHTSELGTSNKSIAPYITGQLEFGYSEYNEFPLDAVNGRYPKQE